MPGKVIAVAQQKGKTTMTAHLAAAIAETGKRVALLDIDPQGTLSTWAAIRAKQSPSLLLPVEVVSGHRVQLAAEKLLRGAEAVDVVLIDAPPHSDTDTRQALRAADLTIAPIQPSPLDLWASKPVADLAAAAKCSLAFLLNRTPPRARLTDTVAKGVAELGGTLLKPRIGARVAFASAMGEGLTVLETQPKSIGAEEVRAAAKAILKLLK
jgi:chromosome partitioning protein